MALFASQSTVDRWYKDTSWVYKNFSYLFSNPLWQKNIPNGFSLCPYFWLAVGSMLFLRPLVYAVLFFRWTIKVLRLSKVVELTDKLSNKIFKGFIKPNMPYGMPTMAGMTFTFLIGVVITAICMVTYQYWIASAMVSLVFPAISFITLFVCAVYMDYHKDNPNRCKVEYYMYGVLLVSIVVSFFLQPVYFKYAFYGLPKEFVTGLWFLVSETVKVVGTFLWHGIKFVLFWAFGFAVSFTTTAVVGGIMLAIIGISGYFIERKKVVFSPSESKPDKESPEEHQKYLTNRFYVHLHDRVHETTNLKNPYTNKWFTVESLRDFIKQNKIAGIDQIASTWDWSVEATVNALAIIEPYINAETTRMDAIRAARKAKCEKYTSIIGKILGVVFWLPIQLWTFVAMLWQTFWAFKKGACPYKMFEKSNKDPLA